jgi:hypothetical protein
LFFASGSIHDLPRSAGAAILEVCGVAPGAPIGGCDPPQPASKATATAALNAQSLKLRLLIAS